MCICIPREQEAQKVQKGMHTVNTILKTNKNEKQCSSQYCIFFFQF